MYKANILKYQIQSRIIIYNANFSLVYCLLRKWFKTLFHNLEKYKAHIFKSLIPSSISFTGLRQLLYVHVCAGVARHYGACLIEPIKAKGFKLSQLKCI